MERGVLVDALRDVLGSEPSVRAAYLFGSVARAEAGPESDVDVAVLLGDGEPRELQREGLRIEGELERRVGRTVQVVVLNLAPVDLVHRVLRDSVLLSEADRSARIRFEVRARNEYFDLLPFLRRYRRLEERPA
jgi:predicted nucleotidyltransferase